MLTTPLGGISCHKDYCHAALAGGHGTHGIHSCRGPLVPVKPTSVTQCGIDAFQRGSWSGCRCRRPNHGRNFSRRHTHRVSRTRVQEPATTRHSCSATRSPTRKCLSIQGLAPSLAQKRGADANGHPSNHLPLCAVSHSRRRRSTNWPAAGKLRSRYGSPT